MPYTSHDPRYRLDAAALAYGGNCAENAAQIARKFNVITITREDVERIRNAAYLLAMCESREGFDWGFFDPDWETVCEEIASAIENRHDHDAVSYAIRSILLPLGFDPVTEHFTTQEAR